MNSMSSKVGWALAILLVGAAAWPQHEEHHQQGKAEETPASPAAPAPEMCKMMQQSMQDMHGKMMAKHAELQRMVNEMNSATGQTKVDAIARVVTAMADHQGDMHQMEMTMMQDMMSHMGGHMMQGMKAGEKKEMMQCPMMSGHGKAEGDAPAQEHQHGE